MTNENAKHDRNHGKNPASQSDDVGDGGEDSSLLEKVGEAIRSEDEPLIEQAPAAPFAIVMGTYPIVLIILIGVIILSIILYRGCPGEPGEFVPTEIESVEGGDE